MSSDILTQEILKEIIHYDPDTGVFTWRRRAKKWFKDDGKWKGWNTKFAGKEAGSVRKTCDGKGYVLISIFHIRYQAHRLAYLYMTGEFPQNQTDHIDGCGTNNIWVNLRDVTNSENSKNMRLRSDSPSGFTGVRWYKYYKKWNARISVNNKQIHLGYFSLLEDAIKARKEANIKYGFHPNHGQKRPL